jgi:ceramide glucosyltransferase
MKPLHGAEPALQENLASFCVQDYSGPVQIIFGVQDAADPAIAVVRQLMERFPDRGIELVVDPRRHGQNGKVSNLINMALHVRHDVVVVADSDMRVGPDYLARVVAELGQPGVGGVTCPYYGLPIKGIYSRLSTLTIDSHFLPNVVMGLAVGLADPCFGSTIALRRTTLAKIGGFAAFADILADDYAIGEALRATGHAITVTPFAIGHACSERSWHELWHHELRWARTIRSIDPLQYVGLVITHPLPWALVAALFGASAAGLATAVMAIACRTFLCTRVERAFGLMPHPYWLVPLHDLLSFAVFLTSFVSRAVTWKGQAYRVAANGTLVSDRRLPSP